MAELYSTSLIDDANLVAYYRLEDVNDSKNSYNLTNNGSVAFNAAKFNNGADFGNPNSTKYLSINNNLGNSGGNVTICGWIKMNGAISGNPCIFSLATNTNYIRYFISLSSTQVGFTREREWAAFEGFNYTYTLNTNWHHLALTYDGTYVRGYIDGSLVGTPTAASGNGVNGGGTSDAFMIGSYDYASPNPILNAIIDDVAVFSKALSADEIATLYKEGSAAFLLFM